MKKRKLLSILLSATLLFGGLTGFGTTAVNAASSLEPITVSPVYTGAAPSSSITTYKNLSVDYSGNLLVWTSGTSAYMYNNNKAETKVIMSDTVALNDAIISSDGTYIIWKRTASASSFELIGYTVSTGLTEVLFTSTSQFFGKPTMTPDASKIAFVGNSTFNVLTRGGANKVIAPTTVSAQSSWDNSGLSNSPIVITKDGSTVYLGTFYSTYSNVSYITPYNLNTSTIGASTGGVDAVDPHLGGLLEGETKYWGVSFANSSNYNLETAAVGTRTPLEILFNQATTTIRPQAISPNGLMYVYPTLKIKGWGDFKIDSSFAGFSGDNNTLYTYTDTGFNRIDLSYVNSNISSIPVPSAPVVTPTVKHTGITLTWTKDLMAVSGVKVYKDGVLLTTVAYGTYSYTDTTVGFSTDYKYEFEAINYTGTSQKTSVIVRSDSGVPGDATNIAYTPTTSGINLTWELPLNAQGYGVSVYRNGYLLTSTAGNTGYSDNLAMLGETYKYEIQTKGRNGMGNKISLTASALKGDTVKLGNKSVGKGDYVDFAGLTWRVVGDNFLSSWTSLGVYAYDTNNADTSFTPARTTNIAYLLNSTYLNTMTESDKSLVKKSNWVVSDASVNTIVKTVTSKIGLLSMKEIANANLPYVLPIGWTITPVTPTTTSTTIYTTGGGTSNYNATVAVFPAIHMEDAVAIESGNGTTANPYVFKGYLDGTKVDAPSSVIKVNDTVGSVEISWTEVPEALLYKVYRNGTEIASTIYTSYKDANAKQGDSYIYTIKASNGTVDSAYSKPLILTVTADDGSTKTPVNFKASSLTSTSVRLDWNANGSDAYEVKQNGSVIYTDITSFIELNSLTAGTTLTFDLTAIKGGVRSIPVTITVTTPQDVLAAPSRLTVTNATYYSLDLEWAIVGKADYYTLETLSGEILYNGTATAFSHNNLLEGKTYNYVVKAHTSTMTSAGTSASGTTTLEADAVPNATGKSLTLTLTGTDSIRATWDEIPGSDSYTVKRNGAVIASGLTELELDDENLAKDTAYTYTVQGANGHGLSSALVASLATPGDAPAQVEGFKVTRVSFDSASMQWNLVPGADTYKVFRDGGVLVYSGPLTTFKDITLEQLSKYSYTVVSVNKFGTSSVSNTVNVSTPAEPVTIILVPGADPAQGTITWKFEVIEGISEYSVERNPEWVYTLNSDGTYDVNYRNTKTDTYSSLGKVSVVDGKLPFTETGVTPGTTYDYTIVAYKTGVNGEKLVVGETPISITTPTDGSGVTIPDTTLSPSPGTGTTPDTGTTPGTGGGSTGGGGGTPSTGGGTTPGTGGTTPSTGGGTTGSGDTGVVGTTPTTDTTIPPNETDSIGITPTPFTDLGNHWATKEISYLAGNGIIKGYADGTFKPNAKITRAEFAIMLKRAMSYSSAEASPYTFVDLNTKAWYMTELTEALAAGVTKGFTDSTYRPNVYIPREQASIMISNILLKKFELSTNVATFTDYTNIIDWAKESVNMSYSKGIISGFEDKSFKPKQEITRAESAVMIYRLLEVMK